MKPVVLVSVLVLYFTGFNTVKSLPPQPNIQTASVEEHLAKLDSNDSNLHHLEGELPPKIFPGGQAVAKLTTKLDINRNNNTEHDNMSNNTSVDKKSAKVASEIPDLLNPDYLNVTTYEDKIENPINNDTETVNGPHVINDNKTHEEDASSIGSNCTVTQENNSSLKNECVTNNATNKNETDETSNNKNDLTTTTPLELTTELGVKQNPTEGEIETTTNVSHEELEKVTDANVGNESTTEESTNIPIVVNTTVVNASESNNVTIELEPETTPVTKETTEHIPDNVTVTDQLETTSVNVSENIINHKEALPSALAASQQHDEHSKGSSEKSSPFLQPTESAAILAAVFVAIALLGYVGLLVWRKVLEKRYGNREVLVNEDDFYDTNDLRNFEL